MIGRIVEFVRLLSWYVHTHMAIEMTAKSSQHAAMALRSYASDFGQNKNPVFINVHYTGRLLLVKKLSRV